MTARRRSRDLEPVRGEVIEPPPVEARPVVRRERAVVESVAGLPVEPRVVNNYYVQAPADPALADDGWPLWKRLLGWVVTIVGTATVIIALLGPPHIVRSHHAPPDLVHQSR